MTTACRTPVVVFVYNRPDKVRRLLDVLAQVRPGTLLVVADGPRADRPDDPARIDAVRRLIDDRIGWPCDVRRDESPTNQGCDARIPSGIDWAFRQVDEAILLEDDIVPDPSFFGWCDALLERYRGSDTVLSVSGRNTLGRWGGAADRGDDAGAGDEGDHRLIARGSPWGWATWGRAWRHARAVPLPGDASALDRLVAEGRLDPWVARHLDWSRAAFEVGALPGWDAQWELRRCLLGGLAAVPPVNLTEHAGFDADATHATEPDSLHALQIAGTAPPPDGRTRQSADHRLDRWSLFIDLLDNCRAPRMTARLAQSRALQADLRIGHALGPFLAAADASAALRHLRAHGRPSARLEALIETFERLAAKPSGTAAAAAATR